MAAHVGRVSTATTPTALTASNLQRPGATPTGAYRCSYGLAAVDWSRVVSYDREEWRRPWRLDDPRRDEGRGAPAFADDSTGSAGPAAPTGAAGSDPLTRFPQPPPDSWNEQAAGPGSPSGSVRPPDTTGTVDAPARRRGGRGGVGLVLGAVLGAIIGTAGTLAVLGVTGTEPQQEPAPTATEEARDPETVQAPSIEPLGEDSIVPAVAEAVTPSVVRIDVRADDDPEAFGGGRAGLGSGVIYSSDGHIITNHHVIDGASQVDVRLSSGEMLEASVVGSDELNDIAVLEVEETGLPAINLRPADEPVRVGETVVAIGSPFGLDASVSSGIVSALEREIQLPPEEGTVDVIPGVVQTDAAINPGNSGGALVDAQGRLVGINTAILSRTGASQGVGFAVSATQAVRSADQLIEQGFVRQPLLGIAGNDVDPQLADEFDLPASRGAVVQDVQEGTGAADADVRVGDIIVEVDGEQLATMSELVAEVRARSPGEVIELGIIRDGEELTIEVEIGERPRDDG